MANRFCSSCGARLVGEARFCVECGEAIPGMRPANSRRTEWIRHFSPLWVLLSVLVIGGTAVGLGTLSPKLPARIPPRGSAPAETDSGSLPQGHPPIAVPEQAKQAIRELVEQAEKAPDDLEKWKQLGEVQYRAAQVDPSYLTAAATAFRHVLDRAPDDLDAMRALGNIAFDQEEPTTAIDYYRRYLEKKPDDREVRTDLGTMYLSAGQTDEAIRIYDEVLKAAPGFFQAQFNLGLAYRTAGDQAKALSALEKSRGMAADDKTRSQVDQVIARIKGAAPGTAASAPSAAPPAAAAAPEAGAGTFRADVEALFRQSPIMGTKVAKIEWQGDETARVLLREFPMAQMGDEMRDMFLDRMKSRLEEKKQAHSVTAAVRVDLVDADSGAVMGTFTK